MLGPTKLVTDWQKQTGGELDADELRFVTAAMRMAAPPWLRSVDRLALEGPADRPKLVTYFQREDRPGVVFGFEWPLREDPPSGDQVDEAVWVAHTDEVMGAHLPTEADPDGVVRFGSEA